MGITLIVLVLLALLFIAFVLANWSAIVTPVPVSLLLLNTELPLGLVLLGCLVVAAVVFAVYAISLKTRLLVDMRRMDKELREQRLIADQAEASRIASLEAVVKTETAALGERIAALGRSLDEEEGSRFNGLYAHLGEIDDKLDRALGRAAPLA
ncbi:lipopolysaccharide assembly protein LapA domain-containing protein [Niveibacterium sp. SC-1]|uniref:lipopolysaccharide assembly protein LapA domain-containing protein n=1 Tax=Niveibacterium sp. SC-1 TaxID=3135646 RepID=UPI00311EF996